MTSPTPSATAPGAFRRLPLPEFTAMLAMLFATIAFSIDAMLPALPQIAGDLVPDAPNQAQLILSAFVLGLGTGTLFVGPLSDAFGRKPVIAAGLVVYVGGAMLARQADGLEFLLAARFLQGLGASGPRIAGVALTRDLYEGREMARVMSFVMMVFMIVPALAPMIGAGIIALTGWRGIFLAFTAFGLVALTWVSLRQDETLPPAARRSLRPAVILDGLSQVLKSREVRLYTLVMTLGFGQMMALLSSIQQIFDQTYGRGQSFPYWFALIAAFSATASFLNGRLVGRFGMRRLVLAAYLGQFALSCLMVALFATSLTNGPASFLPFYVWATSVFFIAGFTFGNLNALAMQTMGHVAGMATSVIAAISTVLAVLIAGPVGLAFDGTPVPAMAGAAFCSGLAFLLMRKA